MVSSSTVTHIEASYSHGHTQLTKYILYIYIIIVTIVFTSYVPQMENGNAVFMGITHVAQNTIRK